MRKTFLTIGFLILFCITSITPSHAVITNPGTEINIDDILQSLSLDNYNQTAGGYRTGNSKGFRPINHFAMNQLLAGGMPVYLVNDCETTGDWTASAATFTKAVGATGNRIGTNALALATSTPVGTGEYMTTSYLGGSPRSVTNQIDWRDSEYIGLWISSTGYDAAGELKININNNGSWGTAIAVPTRETSAASEYVEVFIGSFDRDKVQGFRFENANTNNAETIYVDHIQRYLMGTKHAPVMGPCKLIEVKDSVSTVKGNLVNLENGEVVDNAAANDVGVIGIVVIGAVGSNDTGAKALVQYAGNTILKSGNTITAGYGLQASAVATVIELSTLADSDEMLGRANEASALTGNYISVQLAGDGTLSTSGTPGPFIGDLTGNVTGAGTSQLNDLNVITNIDTDTLAVAASATVGTTLGVSGVLTASAGVAGNITGAGTSQLNDLNVTTNIDAATIATSGTATLQDLNVTTNIDSATLATSGLATIGTTLGVTGVLTASAGVVGDITGNITGAGTSALNDLNVATNIDTGTMTSTGVVNLNDLNVAINVDTLTLATSGAATVGTTLGVTGLLTASGGVAGDVTGNVTGAGTSTLNDLNVSTNIDTGTLTAIGTVNVNDFNATTNIDTATISTTGAAIVGTTLNVTGLLTASGGVAGDLAGNVTGAGTSTLNDLNVTNNIDAATIITSSSITANGNIGIAGVNALIGDSGDVDCIKQDADITATDEENFFVAPRNITIIAIKYVVTTTVGIDVVNYWEIMISNHTQALNLMSAVYSTATAAITQHIAVDMAANQNLNLNQNDLLQFTATEFNAPGDLDDPLICVYYKTRI